jgi:hypothetical protein
MRVQRRRPSSALGDDRAGRFTSPLRPFAPLAVPTTQPLPVSAHRVSTENWENLTEDAYYQMEAWERDDDDDDLWLPVSDVQVPPAVSDHPYAVQAEHSDSSESDVSRLLLILQSLRLSSSSSKNSNSQAREFK